MREEVVEKLDKIIDFVLWDAKRRNDFEEAQKAIDDIDTEYQLSEAEYQHLISSGAGDMIRMVLSMPEDN